MATAAPSAFTERPFSPGRTNLVDEVKLNGVKSNRSAIGGRVVVRYGGRVQAQEVLGQASFLSVNDRRLHFGLGQEKTANIEVRWPSGIRQSFAAVPANRLVTIDEMKGVVKSEVFPQPPAQRGA